MTEMRAKKRARQCLPQAWETCKNFLRLETKIWDKYRLIIRSIQNIVKLFEPNKHNYFIFEQGGSGGLHVVN